MVADVAAVRLRTLTRMRAGSDGGADSEADVCGADADADADSDPGADAAAGVDADRGAASTSEVSEIDPVLEPRGVPPRGEAAR